MNYNQKIIAAGNPNTPPAILKILAADSNGDSWIQRLITQNPNAPLETLQQLASHSDYYVRWQVTRNPNMS
jgi:hypothetical protein